MNETHEHVWDIRGKCSVPECDEDTFECSICGAYKTCDGEIID